MYGISPLDLHCQFDVRIMIVPIVDEAGVECPECDTPGAVVEANTYYNSEDGTPELVCSCWACVPLILESKHGRNAGPARIELGSGFVHGE